MTENIIPYFVNGKEKEKDLSGQIKQLIWLSEQFDGEKKICIEQVQSICPGELIEFYKYIT